MKQRILVLGISLAVTVGGIYAFAKLLQSPNSEPKSAESTARTQASASVAGELTQDLATPTPAPFALRISKPLIDCVGPDGRHAQATQSDCDNLNSFWSTHTPQSNYTTANTTGGTSIATSNNIFASPSPGSATPTPTPVNNTSGTITVSTNSVNVTLSRANAQNSLIYGTGFTVTSQGAIGWSIHYSEPTSGQGFYESSGGMIPGGSTNIRTYINTNKTNGEYTGSAVVFYDKDGSWQSGPTVTYTINLTD